MSGFTVSSKKYKWFREIEIGGNIFVFNIEECDLCRTWCESVDAIHTYGHTPLQLIEAGLSRYKGAKLPPANEVIDASGEWIIYCVDCANKI